MTQRTKVTVRLQQDVAATVAKVDHDRKLERETREGNCTGEAAQATCLSDLSPP